jgi:hypothetical protein
MIMMGWIINGPQPFGIDSTVANEKNVAMVTPGAREGEGQNNVVIYMDFVLVHSRKVGTKSC